jgi:hypothetical protein
VIEQALIAGARVLIPATHQLWGDRVGVWPVASWPTKSINTPALARR